MVVRWSKNLSNKFYITGLNTREAASIRAGEHIEANECKDTRISAVVEARINYNRTLITKSQNWSDSLFSYVLPKPLNVKINLP